MRESSRASNIQCSATFSYALFTNGSRVTILAVMTLAMAHPSLSPIYHPQLFLLYRSDCSVLSTIFISATRPTYAFAPPGDLPPPSPPAE